MCVGGGGGGGGGGMLSQPYTRCEYFIHSPVSSLTTHTLLAVPLISRASVVQARYIRLMLCG